MHALDTTGLRAVCTDLPSLAIVDIGAAHLGLTPGGETLQVDVGGVTRAVIDTRAFTVSPGGAASASRPARPAAHGRRGTGSQDVVPWVPIALAIAILAVLAAAGRGLARSRRGPIMG